MRSLIFTPELAAVLRRKGKTETRRLHAAPKFAPGEQIGVRERWSAPIVRPGAASLVERLDFWRVVYAADGADPYPLETGRPGWLSPIAMPDAAIRTVLRIREARQEHLQAITEEAALAEGIIVDEPFMEGQPKYAVPWAPGVAFRSARFAFAEGWDLIHPKRPWASNPLVVVYRFDVEILR